MSFFIIKSCLVLLKEVIERHKSVPTLTFLEQTCPAWLFCSPVIILVY